MANETEGQPTAGPGDAANPHEVPSRRTLIAGLTALGVGAATAASGAAAQSGPRPTQAPLPPVRPSSLSAAPSSPVAEAPPPSPPTPPPPPPEPPRPPLLAPEIERIRDRGHVIVAMNQTESPPFSFYPDGPTGARNVEAMLGHDVKLIRALAQALNVDVQINNRAGNFNAVIDMVANGDVDLGVSKLSMTYSRAARVSFSDPYVELRHGMLVNRLAMARLQRNGNVSEIFQNNFAGRIGVIAASSFVEITREQFPAAKIVELPNWRQVVDAANDGRVDVAYRDELEIKREMRLRPELAVNLRSILVNDRRDLVAAAIPWSSHHLLRFMNFVISRNASGGPNKLLDDYPQIFEANQQS